MSNKKKKTRPVQTVINGGKAPAAKPAPAQPSLFPWNFKTRCYIILILGFIFYANSLANKYALDDSIAIEQNAHVQKGIGGIGKILTRDSYDSFYKNMGVKDNAQYSGGRYRPLSLVTFALEESIFGNSPFVRHFVNVMAFLICLLIVFYFLNDYLLKKLPGGSDVAFISVVLFAIHPIHTEVVANIKSLDEILSLALITGTFIFSLRYFSTKNTKDIVYGCICYFLALLAKEYAITLVILLPLLFYTMTDKKPGEIISAVAPYYGVVVVYLLMRFHAVGIPHSAPKANDPLVDPFLYATHSEKIATQFYALGWYIRMLFCPWPLSCDYSYSQIPYHHFSDISVIVPILLYIAITVWAFTELKKRSVIGFLLFFFLGCIALISNFVVDLGAVMGERLLFHASIAFLVILSYYALNFLQKTPFNTRKTIVTAGMALLIVVSGAITIPRNAQWKDDDTLFIHDVRVCPNSELLNNDAGWCYVGMSESPANKPEQARAYLDSAKKYLYKGLSIHKDYASCNMNLATVYFHYSMPDSALHYINEVKRLNPNYPSLPRISGFVSELYLGRAMVLGAHNKTYEAISNLKIATALAPDSANIWYNLGGAYYTIHNFDSARYAWSMTLRLNPNYSRAKQGLQALPQTNSQ